MAYISENSLGFEEVNGESEDDWPTGKSVASLTAIRDYEYEEESQKLDGQDIIVIPQKKIHTDRSIIPATVMEKLSYYRAFTSSSSKIEILCMQQNKVNRFMWFYISNTLCKSLSMTYVYIFLSAYAPDHHFFVPKMVPICYGLNFINVISARFLLQTISFNSAMHIFYAIIGVIFRAPWNRCISRHLEFEIQLDNNGPISYTCLELEEFREIFENQTIERYYFFYISSTEEKYSVAQIEYYDFLFQDTNCMKSSMPTTTCLLLAINISIWITAVCLHNHLFKKYIWKILHYAQISLCVLLVLIFFHLVVSYEDKEIQRIEDKLENGSQYRETLMFGDYDMLAETMTAPPIAHIISARTTAEIKPSLSSAMIVISNGVYYIFKALTSYLMKKHCERWVGAPIIHWNYGSSSIFYFWPIYFATIKYGAVIAVIFFALNGIVEFCMFVITFQCLIEVVKYEWRWVKPWCMSAILLISAILELLYFVRIDLSVNSYIFYTSLSSLAEIVIIFWMYPLNRFLDDITFHFGVPPTRLRRWSFWFLPIYYIYKVFVMLLLFYWFVGNKDTVFSVQHKSRYAPTCMIIMFVVGAVYSYYDLVIRGKKGFGQLFKPLPEWGPKDFRLRQLRKQFDSRNFIVSQAPRELSRYLIEKSGLVSYKLDVAYELLRWRSTSRNDEKEERLKEL